MASQRWEGSLKKPVEGRVLERIESVSRGAALRHRMIHCALSLSLNAASRQKAATPHDSHYRLFERLMVLMLLRLPQSASLLLPLLLYNTYVRS
jgi:hypothetical protein